MVLTHIPLDDITIQHFEELIKTKSAESHHIDYKRELYARDDDGKKEFLKDISSFANTGGGDIIIGINEDGGIPLNLIPVKIKDIDQEICRLDQIARSNLEPQIFNLKIRAIPYLEGNIIIIRIPTSYNLPHRVILNKKFHVRGNSTTYEPDISTLRNMFNSTLSFEEQVKKWRDERIDKILSRRTPVILDKDTAILAIHLIPYSFTDLNTRLDLTKIGSNKKYFIPHNKRKTDGDLTGAYCNQSLYNFDGYLFYSNAEGKDKQQRAYTQIFRSGAIESVSSIGQPYTTLTSGTKRKGLISIENIQKIITYCSYDYAMGLYKLGIAAPVLMSISLLSINDYAIGRDYSNNIDDTNVIMLQEKNLIFTEVVLPKLHINEMEYKKLLKPLLEHLMNTVGLTFTNNV